MTTSCVVLLPVRVFGGHEKMLVRWLREAAANHALRLYFFSAPNPALAAECEAAGLGMPAIRYPGEASALRDFYVTWRLLARVPREIPVLFAPGVVQSAPLQWIAAFLRRRRVGGYVPMAYSCRRMGFRGGAVRDWIVGQVIRHADFWITITREQRDLLSEHWHVRSPVFVVPNRAAVLDEPLPKSSPARAVRPLRALFAGRFDAHQKGLDWLCDRLRARRDRWRGQWHFAFKGEGSFRPALERLATELGGAHVEILPWGETAEAMQTVDVLLLPSRFEGLPLVALEAIHRGLPVAASRAAGVSDLVPSWCLFDLSDDESLWAALAALEAPAARAAALAHGRARMRELLGAASFEREIAGVVSALASPGPNRAAKLLGAAS